MATPIVSLFLSRLTEMGIRQVDIARHLGCCKSHVSRLKAGARTLPLEDLRGLLQRLCRAYPTLRIELAQAAVGPLLEGSGLRLVAGDLPPAPMNAGQVIDLEEWRVQRRAA